MNKDFLDAHTRLSELQMQSEVPVLVASVASHPAEV